MELPELVLKKNEDRRLRTGHLWIFSNEVDVDRTPLKGFEPGSHVLVRSDRGKPMGTAYVNPNSLICARLVSRRPGQVLDKSLIKHRLNVARSMRDRIYEQPFYRAVFGESDRLPGLVVDRYDDVLVAQITTAGMEARRDDIVQALTEVYRPRGILFRNDLPVRDLEGLPAYSKTAAGEVPDEVTVPEGGVEFRVDLRSGQKTGWFFDQRDNRTRLMRHVRGMRVLDVFSYVGAWGVRAAAAGAEHVTCLDSSADALRRAGEAAREQSLPVETLEAEAVAGLKMLRDEQRRFDVVVLDPPAFIKRRKDVKEGTKAYRRLNQLALQVLARDGLLVSASCSWHMSYENLLQVIQGTASHMSRHGQLLETGFQGPDHPVHPAIPETGYLKACFARMLTD